MKRILISFVIVTALFLSGCGKMMSATEVGEEYKELPKSIGGGYVGRIEPGNLAIYNPLWTSIYVIDTKQRTVTWTFSGEGSNPELNDSLNTRSADGNEVWLSITVQFHIDPTKTRVVVEEIGYDEDEIETAIEDYARSKIRSHLGELEADEFYDNKLRYIKVGDAKIQLNSALSSYGIIIENVNLDSHKFDSEYQNKIDLTKKTEQEAQQAFNQIATMMAGKEKELQETVGAMNKIVADADGKKQQAIDTGDAYYASKENEAAAIRKEGENIAKVIVEKIESLKRSGGESVVRLEIGKQLMASGAPFYLINRGQGGSGNLDMSKIDYNQFLEQIGQMSLAGENTEDVSNQPQPEPQAQPQPLQKRMR